MVYTPVPPARARDPRHALSAWFARINDPIWKGPKRKTATQGPRSAANWARGPAAKPATRWPRPSTRSENCGQWPARRLSW